jgi:hypothetical protein
MISEFIKPSYLSKYRPEAGLTINNTNYISQSIFFDKNNNEDQ